MCLDACVTLLSSRFCLVDEFNMHGARIALSRGESSAKPDFQLRYPPTVHLLPVMLSLLLLHQHALIATFLTTTC
jgi:hypothetical protein